MTRSRKKPDRSHTTALPTQEPRVKIARPATLEQDSDPAADDETLADSMRELLDAT